MTVRTTPTPMIIGHRGASGYRPEHTRSAYELAFALGAEAVEPDIVATKDGVLVVRHENEISGTTDVASHPEFAARRTTKLIDGHELTGWFTEDFTWDELSTLRARERLGALRQSSASFDGHYPILRLSELVEIIDRASADARAPLGMVAEIKHATYFASIGLPLDELLANELDELGWGYQFDRLTIESFEQTVLHEVRARGVKASYVYLIEASGKPADLVARSGAQATSYADVVTPAGLYGLSGHVDGVSVDKSLLLRTDAAGRPATTELVDHAHAAGLQIFTWTLRPENRFLSAPFRRGRAKAAFGDWQGEWRLIMGTGIDGIFADHPDLALALRDEL
ncbi:glycerophosphodiester phosphodiesterase family protein [Compostimonas suwonensis]|uniref:glycerophosphodiester phosphodiesterase n=1 Tax=Compostimonas suwonensis TaxID=1048394 RepID=A0A2M9BV92_9MICO|nr:glycerophosphodiester phosphodiesterase family protein [Compostimonas suwonensis]PJJ61866.1 glycerophosphoryl diester phosphodiesterase [Compostimonas suwonensis]